MTGTTAAAAPSSPFAFCPGCGIGIVRFANALSLTQCTTTLRNHGATSTSRSRVPPAGFSFADARRGGALERASATRRGLRSSAVQRRMRARDRGARRRARRSRTHRPASLVRTESRARTFAARSNVNVVRFAKKGAKSHARGAKIACPRDRIVVTQTTMRRKIQTP